MATKENMKKWEDANKKLAEAHKKREAERGTSKTTNPLMKDFKERMEKRETEKAKEEAKATKKAAEGGGSKYGPTAMKGRAQLVTLLVVKKVKAIQPKLRLMDPSIAIKSPPKLLVSTKRRVISLIRLHRLHHVSVVLQAVVI
jgi:hypothetical protein